MWNNKYLIIRFIIQQKLINYLILQVSGLGVLIAGAVFLAEVNEFDHFLEGRVLAPSIVLIIIGLLVFLIASLGCYGAIRESPPLLMTVIKSPTSFVLNATNATTLNVSNVIFFLFFHFSLLLYWR